MPMWPSTLPEFPTTDGWTKKPLRNVAVFQPEVGPPKFRRRSTAAGSMFTMQFVMTTEQVRLFVDYFMEDLQDGVLPFTIYDPVSDQMISLVFEDAYEISGLTYGIYSVNLSFRMLP